MSTFPYPYVVLAAAVAIPCGATIGALAPAIAVALIITNTLLWCGYRIAGGRA